MDKATKVFLDRIDAAVAQHALLDHRHRFEVNPDYIERFKAAGLRFTGRDTSGRRMEVPELEGHPYFIASQFHPEFKSRPDAPSPLHLGLVRAALEKAG